MEGDACRETEERSVHDQEGAGILLTRKSELITIVLRKDKLGHRDNHVSY